MMTAARGLALIYSDGRPISKLTPTSSTSSARARSFGIPVPIILLVRRGGRLPHLLLNNTRFGRHVYAIGGNEQAARVSGVNLSRVKIGIYTFSGLLAGLGGMIAGRLGSAPGTRSSGTGYELDAITAAVIGGTSFAGGIGTVWGTIVGALIIGSLNTGLDLLNVSPFTQQVVKGVIIVARDHHRRAQESRRVVNRLAGDEALSVPMTATRRMTVAQALVEFLAQQWTVDGDVRVRTIAGVFGIFGHGNVAGLGQALHQLNVEQPDLMPYLQARNEQAMVHQSVGYARMNRRRSTFASTSSVGPGATNMLTGAALATANRLPALLLPSDTFATRVADPVLQGARAAARPRADRQRCVPATLALLRSRPAARTALLDRARGDARADRPGGDRCRHDLAARGRPGRGARRARRVPAASRVARPAAACPSRRRSARAVSAIRAAEHPLIIAGGGVIYSGAEDALRLLAEATGIPVATTQAGGGSLAWDHPQYLGGVGATGTTAANRIAAEADLVIGIGTRYSDFTTASRTAFQHPDVRFVNVNVAAFDAAKHGSAAPARG